MSFIIRVKGTDWSAKGYRNIFPFVATDDLEYGFDLRDRQNMLSDLTGKHTITPKKVDPAAGILNVTDSSILTSEDNGQGVLIKHGYLQSSLSAIAIPSGGAKQFTIMVASRVSEIAFPAEKVVGIAPSVANSFDWGSIVTGSGVAIDTANASSSVSYTRIASSAASLAPESTVRNSTRPVVLFITYDGTTWAMHNKTIGVSQAKTNADMGKPNPIPMTATLAHVDGKITLGGSGHRSSTLHAAFAVIYQQAFWNRVLTPTEISEQYMRTKAGRAALDF